MKNLKEKLRSLTSDQLFSSLALMFTVATGIVVIVFVFYFMNFSGPLSSEHDRWGTFGDFVGGTLNPILSFFALIAILLTIILQSKELEATREELKRSATAQEKSEASLKKQSEILSRQQFEQTFFSLLEQHNSALEKISTPSGRWTNNRSDLDMARQSIFKVSTLTEAKDKLEQKNRFCGHYFRVLYQLLKFIATNIPGSEIGAKFDKNDIVKAAMAENEKMYSNMVRSFLNYDVSQVLAINCYCSGERSTYWRYRQLLERYEFLEHMPFEVDNEKNNLLINTQEYYIKAFGNSGFVESLKGSG
ncbi:putative phage abortive infection protein [Methylophaga thalassica]|uniref:putative phage abortive infection protein n=1 Tax=Methylophaga aminisulfidivorans TaxID=230105 RepID=UPI0024E1FBD5|nr:putative phage abortive infection protein [Methylophaga aminisulfidivorans]